MSDEATAKAVYKVVDDRWRRLVLGGLKKPQTLPVTAGYDEVCPFFEMDAARPDDPKSLAGARPRPVGSMTTQFLPQDIVGNGTLGTGYIVHEIVEGSSRTVQPGGFVSDQEDLLELRATFFFPLARFLELRDSYTSAYRQLWKRVRLGPDKFPVDSGIFEIIQRDLIGPAVPQGEDGQFYATLQVVNLHRRITLESDPTVTDP